MDKLTLIRFSHTHNLWTQKWHTFLRFAFDFFLSFFRYMQMWRPTTPRQKKASWNMLNEKKYRQQIGENEVPSQREIWGISFRFSTHNSSEPHFTTHQQLSFFHICIVFTYVDSLYSHLSSLQALLDRTFSFSLHKTPSREASDQWKPWCCW